MTGPPGPPELPTTAAHTHAGPAANVTDFLLEGKPGSRTALHCLDGEYSYAALRHAADSIAQFCLGLGLTKGDRVILASEPSFFWVAAYLGTLRAGLVCVPLPTAISAPELAYVIGASEARLAAVQASFMVRNAAPLRALHVLIDREANDCAGTRSQTTLDQTLASSPGRCSGTRCARPEDLAALMFTSGSTGRPRGVMVSHRNIMANTESIIASLALTAKDRIMAVLPFHYCFGTSLLHTHLRVGGSLVLDSRFLYPETILQRMAATQCTGFAGVPSHFQILLRRSSLRTKSFPRLRYVQQAGGHLAPAFIRELQEALPGTQIFIMYGQTEATARLSCLPSNLLASKPGSIGKGIPGVTLRVLDESGNDVRPGETGEIVAEGENVALGYWNEPEATAASFRAGKLYTGDIATVDADGFLYVVDRAKDFLKCGGRRISCRHIEDRLMECPDVLEVAVLGIPDDVLGEAVKAFAVPRLPGSRTLKETLLAFCRTHIPPDLTPREIDVLQSLPKNSSGKVLKQMLRDH